MKKLPKIAIYLILLIIGLTTLTPLSKILAASDGDYEAKSIILNVPINKFTGGQVTDSLLGKYFEAWYDFMLGSVGIIATIIIMWGGFKWLSSRGDAKQISDAKDTIFSAIAGLILAFGSYLIISLINPDLTKIKMPEITAIKVTSNYDVMSQEYSKGNAYNSLGERVETGATLQSDIVPDNKNNGPKVPCPQNSNGERDYGMAYIASHEGYENNAQTDAINTNTQNIYFGHQIQSGERFNGSEEEAIQVLQKDYSKYQNQARNIANEHGINFDNLSNGRKIVLTDMAYNMGGAGLNNFSNMWSALKENNFEQAGKEILNSKYYTQLQQTGRPQMNATIMAADPNRGDEMVITQSSVNCK